jgi:hypothetical protein
MRKGLLCLVAGLAIVMVPPSPAVAQGHGGGGGGGGGCGDVFGDLIHIKRDAVTGQPILAQRWIEMPKEIPGYGWGYCPIAVDAEGIELGFAPLSCDVAEEDLERVEEVDYFGRLNGGRTKERNHRMHFNEVVSSIKAAEGVGMDETGRLALGYGCTANSVGRVLRCDEWAVIDSPMESMALYTRLMKYGHFQTDPMEVDQWAHGDPALGTQYHPALGPEDWLKFTRGVRHLLPGNGNAACFDEALEGGFVSDCAAPRRLRKRDFVAAAAYLAGAANKTGKITVDLVQYVNRILKITLTTEATVSTLYTLPTKVRACAVEDGWVGDPEAEDQDEPPYTVDCTVDDADPGIDNYDLFPEVQELFVDFARASYDREQHRNHDLHVIAPASPLLWEETDSVPLLEWLRFVNGGDLEGIENVDAFVAAASDSLRSIEFVHNYEVPEDLGWDFVY